MKYEAPEVVTIGPARTMIRSQGSTSSEGCGCSGGHYLFADGDELNEDDE
jgi:hypothetical protein